jgi:hypothetical protein
MILGVDPGQLTGIALVDDQGALQRNWNADFDTVKKMLADKKFTSLIDQVVMEQFVLYRNKAGKQVGSKMPASKVIGMVELWASMHNIPIAMQMASVLPIAMKISRVRPVGAHNDNHWVDAYNHAFYWLVKHRNVPTPFEKELKNVEGHRKGN